MAGGSGGSNSSTRRRGRLGAEGERGGLVGAPHPLLEKEQRAVAVGRGLARGCGPHVVVEDLERDRAGIAAGEHRLEEARHVEVALARQAAEVAAQGQRVHADARGIGQLDEEHPLAREVCDTRPVVRESERVEAVEDQAEMRVVRPLDDAPGPVEGAHLGAPGQGLEADLEAALRRPLGELVELVGHPGVVVRDLVPDVGADQDQRRAELFHQVELALGPVEVALQLLVRHALEVAEGLKQVDRQAEVGGVAAHVAGRAGVKEEVVLEDLDPVEARRRDRLQLLDQRAAYRHRGDRLPHCVLPSACAPVLHRKRGRLRRARRGAGAARRLPRLT